MDINIKILLPFTHIVFTLLGKTEAAKECLNFLTNVTALKNGNDNDIQPDSLSNDISARIVQASDILEAFGNASTSKNLNSSRFGKWMEINYDHNNIVNKSTIFAYLLEKSRVTKQLPNERNYHIYYQLLSGLSYDELATWKIFPEMYIYRYLPKELLNSGKINDAEKLHETINAFKTCGFPLQEIFAVLKIVAGILLLGNIEFLPVDNDEACSISTADAMLDWTASIFSVPVELLQNSLISRTIESGIRRSVINIKLNVAKASNGRDSLARGIYEKLFHYIISQINQRNHSNDSYNDMRSDIGHNVEKRPAISGVKCIGLLDIFGKAQQFVYCNTSSCIL